MEYPPIINERYDRLKDVVVPIDLVKTTLRLPKGGLYDSLLNLHKKLYETETQTVDKIIESCGWGRRDISFTKNLYNLAESILNDIK